MFFIKKNKNNKYSNLTSSEKKKVIIKSIREANKEQLELVKNYDKKYRKLKYVN